MHFVIRCFKTRLRRHPSPPPTHPPRLLRVPRAWRVLCMARYGHGVTHATVTHSEVPSPAPAPVPALLWAIWAIWGPGLTSRRQAGPAAADDTSCNAAAHAHILAHPTGRANLHLALSGCPENVTAGIPPVRQGWLMGNLGTNHVHSRAGESGSWSPLSPIWANGVLSVADRDFFQSMVATRTSCQSIRRTAGSFLAHRQNQDFSVRPETSTLGTTTIREDALARLCPTSNGRPRQIGDSDHHMDHRHRLRAKISAEFNSRLLGPQRLIKHFSIPMWREAK